jgi:hypothetical protein
VLGAAGLGAIVAIAVLAIRDTGASCDIEGFAWNRAGLTRALATSPDATRVLAGLDAYQTLWVTARREACEATHVRNELSEGVLAARNACLDRGKREFVELTALRRSHRAPSRRSASCPIRKRARPTRRPARPTPRWIVPPRSSPPAVRKTPST